MCNGFLRPYLPVILRPLEPAETLLSAVFKLWTSPNSCQPFLSFICHMELASLHTAMSGSICVALLPWKGLLLWSLMLLSASELREKWKNSWAQSCLGAISLWIQWLSRKTWFQSTAITSSSPTPALTPAAPLQLCVQHTSLLSRPTGHFCVFMLHAKDEILKVQKALRARHGARSGPLSLHTTPNMLLRSYLLCAHQLLAFHHLLLVLTGCEYCAQLQRCRAKNWCSTCQTLFCSFESSHEGQNLPGQITQPCWSFLFWWCTATLYSWVLTEANFR